MSRRRTTRSSSNSNIQLQHRMVPNGWCQTCIAKIHRNKTCTSSYKILNSMQCRRSCMRLHYAVFIVLRTQDAQQRRSLFFSFTMCVTYTLIFLLRQCRRLPYWTLTLRTSQVSANAVGLAWLGPISRCGALVRDREIRHVLQPVEHRKERPTHVILDRHLAVRSART